MTTTAELALPARLVKPPKDPFFYGWRYVRSPLPNGETRLEQVPLTRWDVLHPEEGDFIVTNENHARNCLYLQAALESALSERPDAKVFFDHRIDWQVPGILPHGPDLTAIENYAGGWNPLRGTFMMREMNARPLLVVEVTSPSTRETDINEKIIEYHAAGIPYYLIADVQNIEDEMLMTVVGYRATAEGYVRLPNEEDGAVWIPTVKLWFHPEGLRVICQDENRKKIPDRIELEQNVRDFLVRAEKAEARAEWAENELVTEKQRTKGETQRAEAEKQRAEAAIQRTEAQAKEIAELRAQIANPPTKNNGHN